MFNSKFSSLLTVLLVVSIIGIVGILIYVGYSFYNKYYINASAQDAVDAFQEAVVDNGKTISLGNQTNDQNGEDLPDVEMVSDKKPATTFQKPTYQGYAMVGTLSIPSIKIEYPVLEKVTTTTLKIALAYLCGPGINEVGNTVIQGHNYRNGLFFSNLSKVKAGSSIFLTDIYGQKIEYEVYRNFQAEATDTSFYVRDTEGKREITLSTCTEDAAIRTIVLAREK